MTSFLTTSTALTILACPFLGLGLFYLGALQRKQQDVARDEASTLGPRALAEYFTIDEKDSSEIYGHLAYRWGKESLALRREPTMRTLCDMRIWSRDSLQTVAVLILSLVGATLADLGAPENEFLAIAKYSFIAFWLIAAVRVLWLARTFLSLISEIELDPTDWLRDQLFPPRTSDI